MNHTDRIGNSVDEESPSRVKRSVWYDQLAIEFGALDELGQHLTLTARLRASDSAAHSPLLLDLAYCPLVIDDVLCSSVDLTMERISRSTKAPMIGLTLEPSSKAGWNGLSIVFSVHWIPSKPVLHGSRTNNSRGILTPCLVLPDAMPAIYSVGDAFGSQDDDLLTRLSVPADLPEYIVVGGIHTADGISWLQVIFGTDASLGFARVRNLHLLSPDYDTSALRNALHQLEPVRTFLGETLSPDNVTHVLFVSDEGVNSFYAPTGGYSSVPPRWLGLSTADKMNDAAIARTLACGWIRGGTRLWGENSVELAFSVAAAYGLLWLAHERRTDAIDRAIDFYTKIAKRSYDTETQTSGNQAIAMALPIFRALDNNAFLTAMTDIIADHWGRLLPQDRLIDLLRSHDVVLPHVFM